MKTIVFLTDSVNRRFLKAYGNDKVQTPNLDRLGQRSFIFDNHWTGSSPCMPARRDLLTGRLGFLERNWGPIEAFDQTLPEVLRKKSIRSHIVTDHYHYQELGGEGYCQAFTTWQSYRGQEHDNQEWLDQSSGLPKHIGKTSEYYQYNRSGFINEQSYPSPKTYQSAADWLQRHGKEDDFMLWVEGFDPHEPFDVSDEYLRLYNDDYNGEHFEWPDYAPFDGSDEELNHIRNRYAATLTMTDHWIGKVLDVCDELELWDDTMIVFTTDHGYMLGEHDLMAKNYMQAYSEVFHIPLMIHRPCQNDERRISALTQNIDLFPTICTHFGIEESNFRNPIHGKKLQPLMDNEVDSVREGILYGVFGKSVNVCDGRYTFFKAPDKENNTPLSLYTSMPTTLKQYIGTDSIKELQSIDIGRFLPWTEFPVYRIPANQFQYGDKTQSFNGRGEYHQRDYLFDIKEDYAQEIELDNPVISERMKGLMRTLLVEHDSPTDQLERLGLN